MKNNFLKFIPDIVLGFLYIGFSIFYIKSIILFIMGLGFLINPLIVIFMYIFCKKNFAINKYVEIGSNDERNIAIYNAASAKAGKITRYLIYILIIFVNIFDCPQLVTLSLILIDLLHMFSVRFFVNKYSN